MSSYYQSGASALAFAGIPTTMAHPDPSPPYTHTFNRSNCAVSIYM